MTPKQAERALSALRNLEWRVVTYAEISGVENKPYVWEREALFRLRGHLMAMLPEDSPFFDEDPDAAQESV